MHGKSLAFALLFGSLTSLAAAQFTTVSGTVTDPNGLPYANGTISAVLVVSGSPTLNGFAYTPPTQPTGLSLNGSFILQLADNTQLSPGGSQWTFTVCSASGTVQPAIGKGPICFTAGPITISGTSQSITSTLSAAALALANTGSGGGGVWVVASTFGVSTGSPDNSTALNNAISATAAGTVAIPAGTYNVCNSINGASFVSLRGSGPAGATVLLACSTMSPNLNLVQWGFNLPTCVQAFGTVTSNGAGTAISAPVQSNVAAAASVSATSTFSSGVITATFSGTFNSSNGIIPSMGASIVGSGFTPSGYNATWTVISSNATTIVATAPGAGAIGNSTISGTLQLVFNFNAGAAWNGQYAFINGSQYLLSGFSAGSYTVTPIGTGAALPGTTSGLIFQGIYSGCPIGAGLENVTLDGNCGLSSTTGLPCNSGGRGLGAGSTFACRGCVRSIVRDVLALHAPFDGFYTEGQNTSFTQGYAGASTNTWGLAASFTGDNLRFAEVGNIGFDHLGPTDGVLFNLIGSYSGGAGYHAGCIPGSFGICGFDTFLVTPHIFNTGRIASLVSGWDYYFQTEAYMISPEAESSGANGAIGVDVYSDITLSAAYGVLIASNITVDNPVGDCLFLNSPPASFSSTFAFSNLINGITCTGMNNAGIGLHATTAANRSTVMGAFIAAVPGGNWSGGCVNWLANSSRLTNVQCVNGSASSLGTGFDFSSATSLNRFTADNLFGSGFATQIKWPPAAVGSRISGFINANTGAALYSGTIPSGLDIDLQTLCVGCTDTADGPIMTRSGSLNFADHGQCTMAAGTCTAQNLVRVYTTAPQCGGAWTGGGALTGILRFASTTNGGTGGVGSVTPSSSVGTDTAVVNWWCYGQ